MKQGMGDRENHGQRESEEKAVGEKEKGVRNEKRESGKEQEKGERGRNKRREKRQEQEKGERGGTESYGVL